MLHKRYICKKRLIKMAIGESGRVVVELDPALKRELHSALREDGRNLKDWMIENANLYLETRQQSSLPLFNSSQKEEAA